MHRAEHPERDIESPLTERERRTLRRSAVLLVAALLCMVGVFTFVQIQSAGRRDYVNQQLHNLACAADFYLPDQVPLGKTLRDEYHCPAYTVPSLPAPPTVTISPSPSTTAARPHSTPAASATPSGAPGPPRVTTTRTATRTTVATRTVTKPGPKPKPSPSPTGLLNICKIAPGVCLLTPTGPAGG